LVKNKNGEYLGVIYLNEVDFFHKHAYLGIYSSPKLKDVGKLLMQVLKEVAFKIAKLHTLKLEAIENNKHAIGFYKKHGFSEEGRLKEFVYKNKKWLDVIVMGRCGK
jgi:UDP-4-amino-4,6-dideoxy-N-acetyl-beta-L-altrosamine N-acetyltransferase